MLYPREEYVHCTKVSDAYMPNLEVTISVKQVLFHM